MKYKFIVILMAFFGIIFYNIFNSFKSESFVINNNKYSSGTSFDWNSLQIVNDMNVGINLGAFLDRRDGLNRDINYFSNDPRVQQGTMTKEEAYLKYYQELDISNIKIVDEDMIKKIKAAGFKAIRLPVTWMDHLYYEEDNEIKKGFSAYDFNYPNDLDKQLEIVEKLKIEDVWMERVKQVVGWILDNDMYCIINMHNDVGQENIFNVKENLFDENSDKTPKKIKPMIFVANNDDPDVNKKHEKYKKEIEVLWSQISESFKDYGPRLLFEGFNEIRVERYSDSLCNGDNGMNDDRCLLGAGFRTETVRNDEFKRYNDLNAAFITAVRNSNSVNNQKRFLIVNSYLAELSRKSLVVEEDKKDVWPDKGVKIYKFDDNNNEDYSVDHVILGVHFYDHYSSCTDNSDEYKKCLDNNGSNCENESNYCTPSEITIPDEQQRSNMKSEPSTYFQLSLVTKKAEELGVPVIIGEFASYLDESDSYKFDKQRAVLSFNYYMRYAQYFGKKLGNKLSNGSDLNGVACFYWDDATTKFKLLNERRPRKSDLDKPLWMYPKIVDAIMKGKDGLTVQLNDDPFDMSVEPENIILENDIVSLKVGDSIKLNTIIYPSYADKNLDIYFESSNNNIVDITEDGLLEGKSVGNVYITVKTSNNVAKIFNVQVCDENNACSINLDDKNISSTNVDVDSTSSFLNETLLFVGFVCIIASIYIFIYINVIRKVDKM